MLVHRHSTRGDDEAVPRAGRLPAPGAGRLPPRHRSPSGEGEAGGPGEGQGAQVSLKHVERDWGQSCQKRIVVFFKL